MSILLDFLPLFHDILHVCQFSIGNKFINSFSLQYWRKRSYIGTCKWIGNIIEIIAQRNKIERPGIVLPVWNWHESPIKSWHKKWKPACESPNSGQNQFGQVLRMFWLSLVPNWLLPIKEKSLAVQRLNLRALGDIHEDSNSLPLRHVSSMNRRNKCKNKNEILDDSH